VTAPAPREAARAVLLDPGDRVMLLRYGENGGFWAHPGRSARTRRDPPGGLGLGTARGTRHQARHARPAPGHRGKEHLVAGRPVRQAERYYLARIPAEAVRPGSATQRDNIRESRWWTLAELASTRQTVYPAGLSSLLRDVLTSGPPEEPVILS
jgi:hypothetical protein